jgi:predicted nucleic acid-binding protein
LSIYADSSFFVSVYVTDRHSQIARTAVKTRSRFLLTPLHRAEWANAVARHVFLGLLTNAQARQIHTAFDRDCAAGLWLQTDLPAAAFETCIEISRVYAPRLGTRTLDTLHVACALELGAECFLTFDDRQKKLAKAAGLKTS